MNVRELQTRLEALGFDPGPIDGIRGRQTIAATKAFQRARGLDSDGIVGSLTLAALVGSQRAQGDTAMTRPWMDEARRLKGLREGQGNANNPVIMDWADDLDIHYSGDDVAWCGLFVAHCISYSLPEESLPTNPLGARNYLSFGRQCDPVYGAVMVFWRVKKSSWQGHVGLYVSEDSSAYQILGGNQSDSVSVARIAKDRFLGARWPLSAPFVGERFISIGSGGLSQNEA